MTSRSPDQDPESYVLSCYVRNETVTPSGGWLKPTPRKVEQPEE